MTEWVLARALNDAWRLVVTSPPLGADGCGTCHMPAARCFLMTKKSNWMRKLTLLATCGCLLQAGGCSFTQFNEFLQTVFLGITAAGAIAILENL